MEMLMPPADLGSNVAKFLFFLSFLEVWGVGKGRGRKTTLG